MQFPQTRLKFVTTYQGKTDPNGWLVLDLAGLDLDGVNKLYLPFEQIDAAKLGGDKAADKLKQARMLLGGSENE
jgi:hypothetical protein